MRGGGQEVQLLEVPPASLPRMSGAQLTSDGGSEANGAREIDPRD